MIKTMRLCSLILVIFALYSCATNPENEQQAKDTEFKSSALRFDGPAKFAAVHSMIRTRDGRDAPDYKVGDQVREFEKASAALSFRKKADLDWKERGPANVGGRTRALIVDPSDPSHSTWYTGSVGGGVWRTTDAGGNWELLTTELTNLATSSLAMSANNTDVIYAGTGEGFGNIDGINGGGVWKSTDKGSNWTALASTIANPAFGDVTRLIIDPNDENVILASTIGERSQGQRGSYILKSNDGGMTWTEKMSSNTGRIQQLLYVSGDFNTQYATVNSDGVYRSVDAGESWNQVFDASGKGIRRIEMAVSSLNPEVAYLSCETNRGSALYFTKDGFNTSQGTVYDGRQANWLGQQGWYDNTIAVHPYNDDLVWVAGAGSMLQIEPGSVVDTVKVFFEYRSETSFFSDIEDSPFLEESAGLALDLYAGLPVQTETDLTDLVDVVTYFGPGRSQKAHLIDVDLNTFGFTYNSMVDVPFEVWDTTNNRQISVSVMDVDGDGQWTYKDYTDSPDDFHDVININTIDYSEMGDPTIQGLNALYKAQYYFAFGKDPYYQGDETNFPEGQVSFLTAEDQGFVSSFRPILDGYFEYTDIEFVGSKTVHVDHHNIIMIPLNDPDETFYVLNANDGGVAFSKDNGDTFIQTGETFSDGSSPSSLGYNVSQFYGVDKMNGAARFIGGTQDNGTWVSPLDPDEKSSWVEAPSGDGFECAWNYANTDLVLETSQFNNLFKSRDGGNSWDNVPLPGGDGPFISRVASSQIEPDLVFMCAEDGVLKSTDFADSWEVIEMPDSWNWNNWGPPIEISLADPNVVWTGSGMTAGNRIAVSSDMGDSFTETERYPQANLGVLTGLATHPNDSQTAYALFSQADGPKILKTEDLGQTWTDLSGFETNTAESSNGFPDMAIYCLLVMPWDDDMMWAGTEIGIFESLDGGQTWEMADNGLPAVAIWEMKIVDDEVVLATHGRGIWSLAVTEINTVSNDELESPAVEAMKLYPNPMSSSSKLAFELTEAKNLDISLVALDGKILRQLDSDSFAPGKHILNLERENLASGNYFVRIKSGNATSTKMLFVK